MSYFVHGEEKSPVGFRFWANHHFFIGYVIALLGFYLLFKDVPILPQFFLALGLWAIIDDIVQHFIQRREIKKEGHYHTVSFWYWFPAWLIKKVKGENNER